MFCIALSDVSNITAMKKFQLDILWDIEKLLIAYYGDNYRQVLAKGRLSGDEKALNVLNALEKLISDLGLDLAKGENL